MGTRIKFNPAFLETMNYTGEKNNNSSQLIFQKVNKVFENRNK